MSKPIIHSSSHLRGASDALNWDELLQTWSTGGTLALNTGVIPWYPPRFGTIDYVHAAVGAAPTGSTLGLRVNANGTSIGTITFSSAPTYGTFTPSPQGFGTSDRFTVDVYSVGSTFAGGHAVVQFWGKFR